MIDWEGLLKFSLKYSDGTSKSKFKEMSKEDKKFLQGALGQYCNSEIKRITQILQDLDIPEDNNQEERLYLLEELQELLDSLDKGNVLYKMNGHMTLLKIIFHSEYISNRIVALQIFSSANQNDAAVQTDSINSGAMELTELIKKQENMKLKQNFMSAISAMVRGQNLQAKRILIKIGGLDLLKKLMMDSPSNRLMNKINVLFRDLLYYDEFLHQTYNDLSSFSNTAGIKMDSKNCDLKYDVNEEMRKKNYLPENAQYKGCVSKFMVDNEQIKKNYDAWLKEQQQQ